jgi:deoxyuridine 5'-triphosphate nucleotidohydrolase
MALSTNQTAKVKLLSPNGRLPEQAPTDGAGYDVYSADTVTIPAGEARLIKTDMTFIPPEGTYGQLLSRSGLSVKHGINVTAGTIDPDFRGNVMVNLRNTSNDHFTVKQGDRIAQLIFITLHNPKLSNRETSTILSIVTRVSEAQASLKP